jgi:hypothetical protein
MKPINEIYKFLRVCGGVGIIFFPGSKRPLLQCKRIGGDYNSPPSQGGERRILAPGLARPHLYHPLCKESFA